MKKIKEHIKQNYQSILCWIIVLTICFFNGVGAKYLVNFSPMNGTFQNFNPVRRWLNGQVPTRDFATYLGFGHLILGSIMTWIFGGDYGASLCAFAFLTLFSVAVMSYLLGKSILQSYRCAQICTILVFLTSRFATFSENSILHSVFDDAFIYGLGPGNSARFIRGFAPVLYVCIMDGIFLCIKKSKYYKTASDGIKKLIELILVSAVAGCFFTYSNDYGTVAK